MSQISHLTDFSAVCPTCGGGPPGSGGGENLAQTLAIGNNTGGNDIVVSGGDKLQGNNIESTSALNIESANELSLIAAADGVLVVASGTNTLVLRAWNNTSSVELNSAGFTPLTDGGNSLGASSRQWANLLLNGNITFNSTGPQVRYGTGTPEGAVTAPVGSIFLRSDGGTATSVYIKESGAGNTGWVAIGAAAPAAAGGLGVTVHGTPGSGDYQRIGDAVEAQQTIVNVIGDCTETSDAEFDRDVTITLYNDVEVNLGAESSFLWQDPANVTIQGNGRIRFGYTAGFGPVFDQNGFSGRLNVNGIEFVNDSIGASGELTSNDITGAKFTNCEVSGLLVLQGTRNAFRDGTVSANVVLPYNAVNPMVANTYIGGNIVDNASGTVLSDLISF